MNPFAVAARCSPLGLLWATGFGALVVGGAVLTGGPTAVTIAALLALTLVVFAVHSAWKLAQGLHAFAEEIPAPADVETNLDGTARLTWPALSLAVEGEAGVLRDPHLEGRAGGQPFEGPVEEGGRLAEEALADIGVDPERRDHA